MFGCIDCCRPQGVYVTFSVGADYSSERDELQLGRAKPRGSGGGSHVRLEGGEASGVLMAARWTVPPNQVERVSQVFPRRSDVRGGERGDGDLRRTRTHT